MAVGDKYRLHNKLGEKNYIESIGNNEWALRGELTNLRVNYTDYTMTTIKNLDPVGGPFIDINNFSIIDDSGVKRNLKQILFRNNDYILVFSL